MVDVGVFVGNVPLLEVLPKGKGRTFWKLAIKGFRFNSNLTMFIESQTSCNELSTSLIN